jgi:hypothetical protein
MKKTVQRSFYEEKAKKRLYVGGSRTYGLASRFRIFKPGSTALNIPCGNFMISCSYCTEYPLILFTQKKYGF